MDTELRKSYFISDASALYYLGQDSTLCKENVADLLSLYMTNRDAFEKYLDGLKTGQIGLCLPGEYIFIDEGASVGSAFNHMPVENFKKLVNDPDTIRLRYEKNEVILLQYNPGAVSV